MDKKMKLILETCPVCGCGSPGLSYEVFRKWLYYCANSFKHNEDPLVKEIEKQIDSGGDLEGMWAIVNAIMTLNDCTAHDQIWYESYLTKKGMDLLDALNTYKDKYEEINPETEWFVENEGGKFDA